MHLSGPFLPIPAQGGAGADWLGQKGMGTGELVGRAAGTGKSSSSGWEPNPSQMQQKAAGRRGSL